ncbi:MAG TPA: SusC/RagA family TonB-linked outer membrane protein [Chitinophaga sp.]|uniref:SusC/RagA family TonB-linked outer membrane protein n=1 Tax=Chitinophaga sp. TaxID=1869181 RepID=UPI002C10E1B0|nr:SusC/RagA family TonB-linked outer membrane protein [Chitinophaga sp.]HVI46343.1 SusC/RagA family TonB-linked outer membrane protein [Chitinophaga sp.]
MRMTTVLMLVGCLHLSATALSQKITLSFRNAPVGKVLNEISRQSGYLLLYANGGESQMPNRSGKIDISLKDVSVSDALNACLKNQPLMYQLVERNIIIKEKATVAGAPVIVADSNVVVTGIVTDEKGTPMPGVVIRALRSRKTAVTSAAGAFNIGVAKEDRLMFSFIGYNTVERETRGNKSLNIAMSPSTKGLSEVVVTGFQQIENTKFTGSVGKVDKALIQRAGVGDVSKMLQGAVAGVSVENVSSTFGTTPKIRIRGSASISANQEPLYVIDGVPISSPANIQPSQLYSGDPAALLGSAIAGLNPADVEDIVVLKDGSATSLYGTRAANGVISITTKKGKKGQMSVNVGTALTLGLKPNVATFNLMDSKEQMDLSNELYRYGYLSVLNYPSSTGAFTDIYNQYTQRKITMDKANELLNKARGVNTDWFDVLFKNNLIQEHNLSLQGGGDKATYYLSGSYLHDDGQAKSYNLNRYTANLRTVINVTDKLDVDFLTNVTYRDGLVPGTFNSTVNNGEVTRNFELNPFSYAANTSRAMVPYDENGDYKYYLRDFAPFNILQELNENFNTLKGLEIRTALKLNYRIVPGLTYETLLSARKTSNDYSHVMTERSNVAAAYRVDNPRSIADMNSLLYKDPNDPNAIPQTILPTGGLLEQRTNRATFLTMRHSLNWNHVFNKVHAVNVFGGFEMASDKVNSTYVKGFGYQYYSGKIISPSVLALRQAIEKDEKYYSEGFTRENKTAFFLSTNYIYKEKYVVDLAARVDGSNLFGTSAKSHFLPNYSIGLAWNAHKEKFIEALSDKIDLLKVRGSYALRGNAWQSSPALNAIYVNNNRGDVNYNELGIRVASPELFNLNWEKDFTTSFGIDLGLFNKFTLTAEYYSRENKDLVAVRNVAYEDGFNTKTINWASMTNKGVDITLGIRNITNGRNFHWNFNALVGQVKNRVTNGVFSPLLSQKTSPTGYGAIGKPLNGLYAYRFAGLDAAGQPLFYGAKNSVVNNIQLSSQDDSLIAYQGSRDPTVTGSFTNSFSYKSFELRVFFTYSFGNKVFRSPVISRLYNDNLATQKDVAGRWRIPGDENTTNIPGLVSNIQQAYNSAAFIQREFAYNRSDLMVVDAGVLRLSEVALSYDYVPKGSAGKNLAIRSARVTLSGNNLYFWADKRLRGVDPQSIITGVNLPNPTTYSLRINAQF